MYRVVWLRAYARMSRWEEEVVLVYLEMVRTVRAMEHAAQEWTTRAAGSTSGGQAAWATRQAHIWQALGSHASSLFDRARALHQPRVTSSIIGRSIPSS